jgi:acetyl esterase
MDPQVQALIQMMQAQAQANPGPPMWEQPAAQVRATTDQAFAAFNQGAPPMRSMVDRVIRGPAGDIPVKVFTPNGDGPCPLLVYLHGGGWVIGSPETHQKLCAELASGAGAVVVSVGYRLAPEHRAPAALDDCIHAIRWSVEHAAELHADGERFALAGDSAGANLAAAACLRLRDEAGPRPRLQLLLYGVFDLDYTLFPSHRANADGPILTAQAMEWFKEQYLDGTTTEDDPLVSPLRGRLEGLPPAHLIVGTLDPLLDQSRQFARRLEDAGVPARLSVYEDMPHVFLQLSAFLDGGKKGVAEACQALRTALD